MREPAPLSERCTTWATRNRNVHPFLVTCYVERSRHLWILVQSGATEAFRDSSTPLCSARNDRKCYGSCFSNRFQRAQASSRVFLSPSRIFGFVGSPERMKPWPAPL